jgi:2'-5' RNA ligase
VPRLFVATVVPPPAAAALERAIAAVRDRPWRWVPPERWHLTLEYLGDADAEDVASRWARRTRVATPMRLHLAGAGAFPHVRRGKVLWMGLAGDVVAWQRLAGDDQQPHLTIARSPRPADMTAAVLALAAHDGPEWMATEVVLFDSLPGRAIDGGPLYTIVERFPLAASL